MRAATVFVLKPSAGDTQESSLLSGVSWPHSWSSERLLPYQGWAGSPAPSQVSPGSVLAHLGGPKLPYSWQTQPHASLEGAQ